MLSRLNWLILQILHRLWVRATFFALLGIASALAAPLVSPLLPAPWSSIIEEDALADILSILASSMLIVATFSLSTMAAAYAAATAVVTPRVARLLMQDTRAQNALATFVGGFLFSLVGIIALSSDVYSGNGRLVLFVTTVFMVVAIVVTFLRWIDLIIHLGRVGDAIERVSDKTVTALRKRRDYPFLGGLPGDEGTEEGTAVHPAEAGYVQHIDVAALDRLAGGRKGTIHVLALPGAFVDPTLPVVRTTFEPDDAAETAIRNAFALGPHRSFEQDPRFGLVVLSEIAAKALSPGINDPGTAIEVIAASVRVLSVWEEPESEGNEVLFENIRVPGLCARDLFEDAFTPMSHYGAASLSVGIRLQKALAALSRLERHGYREAAREQSALALERARHALALGSERERLAELSERLR